MWKKLKVDKLIHEKLMCLLFNPSFLLIKCFVYQMVSISISYE